MTTQNSERLLSFMASIAAIVDMDPEQVTVAWTNAEYIGYSSYGSDPVEHGRRWRSMCLLIECVVKLEV